MPVPKPSGAVRICVDLTKLNQSASYSNINRVDANSGFWQIQLAAESKLLTTFITPYGRFCFNCLPLGITSAPEHFQRRMNEIVQDLEGVVCLVDDMLVYGSTQAEHDAHLKAALQHIKQAGVTLSKEKCEFN